MTRKCILVIDDQESIRRSFALALEDLGGCQIHTVESGEKGLEKLKSGKYDLIFLDLKMPGMNGVETLREIRKIDNDVPIYIVTAFHEVFLKQLESAVKDGITFELFRKPLGQDEILLVTKGILAIQ